MKINYLTTVFSLLLTKINAFQWFERTFVPTMHVPARKLEIKIDDKYYKKYAPYNETEAMQCLFFTGGNSIIPPEIYNDFLTKLAQKNVVVNVFNEDLKKNPLILKSLTNNEPTVIVAHSSGAMDALSMCKYLDNVERMVLLDPVDSRIFTDRDNVNKIYDLNYEKVNEIFVINAEKSYKWKLFPPRIPFIPTFSLTLDKINVENKNKLNVREYGHSDILDYFWGLVMHSSISEGVDNRNPLMIEQYHEWLAELIGTYIQNKTIMRDSSIIHYVD
jgi:hypothetical protein